MKIKLKNLLLLGALSAFFGILVIDIKQIHSAPVINEVVASFSTSSAQISWSAEDSKQIVFAELGYGFDTSYLSTSTLRIVPANASGTKYFFAAKIKNLSSGTKIYYQIKINSEGGNTSLYPGSFVFPFPDTKSPVISTIKAVAQNDSATISWLLDEEAKCEIAYSREGERQLYKSFTNYSAGYNLFIGGLEVKSEYYYQIFCTDQSGNKTESKINSFITSVISISEKTVKPTTTINTSSRTIVAKLSNSSTGGKLASVTSSETKIKTEEIPALKQLSETADAIKEFADNEEVKQTVHAVVAPTAVGVAAVSAISIFSWVNILPLIQLLLQSFFFLNRKKHSSFGLVYNSLNKLPIDLATVRLVSRETGLVVQSKVTDREGRYLFVVNPGLYKILVIKAGYVFPSSILEDQTHDGQKTNIYHGGSVETSASNGVIALNIPMDPAGEYEISLVKLWLQKALRLAQKSITWVGLIIISVSLYIVPSWYLAVLLLIQIIILIMMWRLSVKPAAKSWGIVSDATSGRPISQAIVRLFNADVDKLVSTQVTDSRGRYFFLASDAKYYLIFEHPSYERKKSLVIDLKNRNSESIVLDEILNKKN